MPTSVVADVVLALALLIYAELLTRLRQADGPAPPWWLGYARDATNLSAMLMLWGAYISLGYRTAAAFLAATLTTLVTYLIDWFLARGLGLRHARLALGLPLLGWVTLVVLLPATVQRGFVSLIEAVQPHSR